MAVRSRILWRLMRLPRAVGDGTTLHLFDPSAGVLQSASDIMFKDSEDGTINLPIVTGDPQSGRLRQY